MRAILLTSLVIMVIMVTINANEIQRRKKKQGCLLNGEVYEAGKVAYEDKTHCLRLKCIQRTNKKGKTKFLLKAKPFKGCRCSWPCPKCNSDWEPVCGTNNKTYVNACQLSGTATPCGRDQAVLLHEGECGKCPVTGCSDISRPVCGSDNKTYNNECQLRQAACDSPSLHLKDRVSCEDAAAARPGKDSPTLLTPPALEPPLTGSHCRYNNKKYALGDTIQYFGNFCLEVTCQPTGRKGRGMITFQEFTGPRSNCECSIATKKNKREERRREKRREKMTAALHTQ